MNSARINKNAFHPYRILLSCIEQINIVFTAIKLYVSIDKYEINYKDTTN